jgi:hypothetical protein
MDNIHHLIALFGANTGRAFYCFWLFFARMGVDNHVDGLCF